jgi:hypothetical protein
MNSATAELPMCHVHLALRHSSGLYVVLWLRGLMAWDRDLSSSAEVTRPGAESRVIYSPGLAGITESFRYLQRGA